MAKRLSRTVAAWCIFAILVGSLYWYNQSSKAGTLRVLCSAAEEVCVMWKKDYLAVSGQEIEMTRLTTNEALTRMRLFRDKPEFDVWQGGPLEGYVQAKQQHLIQPYQARDVAAVNPRWRDPDNYWTGIYLGVLCFCVNTETLQRLGIPAPQDWDDLLAPDLHGQISMSTPTSSGTAFTLVANQISRLGDEDRAFELLAQLDKNVLQYTSSGVAPANIAARGEVAVGLAFDSHCARAQRTHHAPLKSIYPQSGSGYEVGGVAIVAGTNQVAKAREYVDYAVSLRSQQQGMKIGIMQYPTRMDSGYDQDSTNPNSRLIHLNPNYWARQRTRLIRRFQSEILRVGSSK